MVDTPYLEEEIKNSGLKKSYLAEKCGITLQTFSNKMNNKSEFTGSEIKIISKILGLTAKKMNDIFFAENVET